MKLYRCWSCKKTEAWQQGRSQVYGSILMEEEGLPLLYTCSDECRAKIKDPSVALLKFWIEEGCRPRNKVLKSFRAYPPEVAKLKDNPR